MSSVWYDSNLIMNTHPQSKFEKGEKILLVLYLGMVIQ